MAFFSPFSPLQAVFWELILYFIGQSKPEVLAPVAYFVEVEGSEDVFDVTVQCSEADLGGLGTLRCASRRLAAGDDVKCELPGLLGAELVPALGVFRSLEAARGGAVALSEVVDRALGDAKDFGSFCDRDHLALELDQGRVEEGEPGAPGALDALGGGVVGVVVALEDEPEVVQGLGLGAHGPVRLLGEGQQVRDLDIERVGDSVDPVGRDGVEIQPDPDGLDGDADVSSERGLVLDELAERVFHGCF